MARNVAPTKVTGGGGFEFEDKVTAYFICHLLLNRPPLDSSFGIITKISFQVRADRWLPDDLLLELNSGEEKRLCAFSIKSNTQFSKTSAPSDFVQDAWEQYLGEIDSVFNKDKDRLGIITTPLDTDTKTNLEGLLNKARSQDSARLSKRIDENGYVSKEARNIFKSFSCPEPLAKKYSIDETDTGNLLRCIEHLEFDFEHTASKDRNRAVSMIKEILDESSVDNAENLWDTLCSIAREIRSDGGDITLEFIVSRLRSRYRLKDFPDYVSAWNKINQITRDTLDLIPDKIADEVSIGRDTEIIKIKEKIQEHRNIVLLGESGCGKTVIQKSLAESGYDTSKVVWINTETISLIQELRPWEMFRVVTNDTALLVIDGIDRFYEFSQLALLLKACDTASETSPWKIIISSQPDEWARVQYELSRLNVWINFNQHPIGNPQAEALSPVWIKYPALKNLSLHLHLRSFLFKPKILDLFARKLQKGGAFDNQVFNDAFGKGSTIGESHLIAWYWEHEIEFQANGLQQGVLLKNIAEKLADGLTNDILASNFSTSELDIIQELIENRILVSRNSRISFEHDIVADWARLQILLEKSSSVSDYLNDRLSSPLWCRALRLLGIHMLEVGDSIDGWKQLFDSFSKEKEKGNLAQDFLLEASIFSSDPQNNLNKLWTELIKHEGRLLRRLLIRFMYSASLPNSIALLIASQYPEEPISELIAQNRNPYWFYWWPLILFLYSHKEDTIRLARRQLAEIVDRWLRFSKKDWPAREEAADMALDIAEDELALNMSNVMYLDKSEMVKYAYRAGIAAYNEFPDRAFDFILTACSRKAPSGRILELISSYNEEVRLEREQAEKKRSKEEKERLAELFANTPQFYSEYGPTPPPWPDGPLARVDRDFHHLCIESGLDTDILYPLILSDPQKAREVILALLIEHPHPKDRYESRYDECTGLENIFYRWFPPFYTHGPFYFFLNAHPEVGVDLIITLINFATERWAEERTGEHNEPLYLEIPIPSNKKKFFGDVMVYYWHRDVGNILHVIPSVLMALEKWLYDMYDKEDTKDMAINSIEKILESGISLAFVGLLISFGKKNPELFIDTLLPLLSIPEFYSWDIEHIIKSEGHQMIGCFGKPFYKAAHEFNTMEHRKHTINTIAPQIFIKYGETRESFTQYRKEWVKRYEKGDIGSVSTDVFINLINWFDISNWNIIETSEGTKFQFKMPDEIIEEREILLKGMQDEQLLVSLPLIFRLILEGKKELEQFSAGHVWDIIQKVEEIKLPLDDPDINILNKINSICGGIAVLFKFHRDWLKQNKDKEAWCITKLVELILNPPPDELFGIEVSHANFKWDRYCAEIIPILWSEEPENTLYRRCMAILAISKHYETVGILFRATAELRCNLGEHFKQLKNFLIRWAHARWKFYRDRRDRYSDKKSFDIDKWIEKEITLFEEGNTPPTQEAWADIAKDEIDRRTKLYEKKKKERGDYCKAPRENYFDFRVIKAAFSWMPTLDQALSPLERAEWLCFWKQAINWTINVLQIKEDGEISGTPSEWDLWVFEQMATQIFHMEDNENPNELWQPILDLGAEGHYWVDDFIRGLFLNGIGYTPIPKKFTKRWKEILEYAFTSDKWSSTRSRYWYHRNRLWCELLGMGYIIVPNLWGKEKSFIIKEMKPYYERWEKDFLSDPESATYFIHFLQRPATIDLLLNALVWLDNASDDAGERFFTDRHYKVQKPLANLLEMTWKKHKNDIKRNSIINQAFMNLLKKLVDLQNPQAMEIQKNLTLL